MNNEDFYKLNDMELNRKLNRLRKSSGLTSKMDKCDAYNVVDKCIVHFNSHFNFHFYFHFYFLILN